VPAWAGPRGGGGGFGGGGHFGGFSGGIRAAPTFSGGGVRFSGNRNIGGISRVPQQFSYYGGARTPAVPPHASARQLSISPNISRPPAVSRQPNHVGSVAGRNQVSARQTSTAAKRESLVRNHASERHDANWHHDWDRHHAHFHGHKVFVFIDGFWWGLDPGFYPYYAYDNYPDDNYGYANNDYPYDYYEYSPSNYDDQWAFVDSDQYGNNATVSAVQSALAKLGYYQGAIDGAEGDETQAALARYQQDRDLSVTGTLNASTLQALGLQPVASN